MAEFTADEHRHEEDSPSLHDWQFPDDPHTGVYTTRRVMSGEDPVTRVFTMAKTVLGNSTGLMNQSWRMPCLSVFITSSTGMAVSTNCPICRKVGALGGTASPLSGCESRMKMSRAMNKNIVGDNSPYPSLFSHGRIVSDNAIYQ
jgi:hypothetical protein